MVSKLAELSDPELLRISSPIMFELLLSQFNLLAKLMCDEASTDLKDLDQSQLDQAYIGFIELVKELVYRMREGFMKNTYYI